MKIFFCISLNFFITAISFAQQDTLFFDKKWKVCKKEKASFYRIAEPQQGGGYIIKDVYIETNIPQMVAFSTTIEPTFMIGKATYYFPNGKKESEGYYTDNVKTGKWKNWSKNGNDSTVENYGIIKQKVKFRPQDPTMERKVKDSIFVYNLSTAYTKETNKALKMEDRGFGFSPRGKVATFFIIEDVFFLTYTLGAEVGYNKHSLGLDYTWFRWRYEEDNNEDVGMYSQYELRTYLHADYKFTFLFFDRVDMDVYFNAYDKIGKYRMWYDQYEEYDFGTRDMTYLQSKTYGTFNEPGVGFGIRKYAEETGFGIDVSANVGYRFMNDNEQTYISATETDFKDNVKREKVLFYMRINCFYNFGR